MNHQPAPAAIPHDPNGPLTAPHAVYLDAVVTELMAAGIPPRRVTLTTHYDSPQEPLRAGLEWDHETDLLSYNHWPRGLTILWDDSYGWD
ncbi:hypothetical protein E1265_36620, partial [Streptomyces sp. 8K308]|uniref:hypothetical protein n=1 Tax=Streptomyces sp. 8K308 TaxID=2530388 RepID=UPI0010482E0B